MCGQWKVSTDVWNLVILTQQSSVKRVVCLLQPFRFLAGTNFCARPRPVCTSTWGLTEARFAVYGFGR